MQSVKLRETQMRSRRLSISNLSWTLRRTKAPKVELAFSPLTVNHHAGTWPINLKPSDQSLRLSALMTAGFRRPSSRFVSFVMRVRVSETGRTI